MDCRDSSEIEKIISECAAGVDEIWIFGDSEYPALSVIVNGEKAVVHYFSSEQGGSYQSAENDKIAGTTKFLAGGEIWEAPNYTVIPLLSAIECAKQFIETKQRPLCITWNEL